MEEAQRTKLGNTMASKTTITKTDKYHLYREPYDTDRVYLEMKNVEFKTIDNFYGDTHEKKLIVTIPKDAWIELVKGSLKKENA